MFTLKAMLHNISLLMRKLMIFLGIPISQQHLIWQTVELDDEYCLHDYDIHNGATLKLVLAMRGGPINTRRGKLILLMLLYSSHLGSCLSTYEKC